MGDARRSGASDVDDADAQAWPDGTQAHHGEFLRGATDSVQDFTVHLRDETPINQACNLLLVPKWINEVMGYLIAVSRMVR